MTAILDQYISKEAKEAAEARGRIEGEARGRKQTFDIVSEIIGLLKSNVSVPEIATKYKVSTQEVEKLRGVL